MLKLFSVTLILTATSLQAQTICDPASFGAQADGQTKDTAALQSAIDSCAGAGGGVVELSSGVYLTAPITLRTNVILHIDAAATLLGSSDPADYQPLKGTSLLPLIGANAQSDFAIIGQGAIDGAGASWWAAVLAARKAGQPDPARPRLIEFTACQRILVEGVTLRNSPSFHLVPSGCQNVVVTGVTIQAPSDSPNTDGIDPAASRNVRISNCLIDNGDDNVAIKSGTADPNHPGAGSENISVTDCTFLHGHGMSIGSETNGGVRNVQVERCVFNGTTNGLRIKSYRGAGGEVSQISYSDIAMQNVATAILFTAYYPDIPATDSAQPITPLTPFYHDIKVTNLTATGSKSAGSIVGLPEIPLASIVLDHVNISGGTGLAVRNATVLTAAASVQFVMQAGGQVTGYVDSAPPADAVVAADGTGDFRSVQDAIDALPENNAARYVIRIKPGIYYQQVTIPAGKPFITLRGDNAPGTVLVSDVSPATSVAASDFEADNVTFENSYGTGSPAVALYLTADRAIFRNSRFIGWQDTLNSDTGRQYFQNCYVEGDVDFIFGGAAAVFDTCEIHSKAAGYVTAQAKISPDQTSGYVFQSCKLTGANTGTGVYLGRPLQPYAEVIYLNCALGSQIRPEGWIDLSGAGASLTATFGEYRSSGPGANPGQRVPWSRQLSDSDTAPLAPQLFLAGADGWDPTPLQ